MTTVLQVLAAQNFSHALRKEKLNQKQKQKGKAKENPNKCSLKKLDISGNAIDISIIHSLRIALESSGELK